MIDIEQVKLLREIISQMKQQEYRLEYDNVVDIRLSIVQGLMLVNLLRQAVEQQAATLPPGEPTA